mgnify:CR=1 FL=1
MNSSYSKACWLKCLFISEHHFLHIYSFTIEKVKTQFKQSENDNVYGKQVLPNDNGKISMEQYHDYFWSVLWSFGQIEWFKEKRSELTNGKGAVFHHDNARPNTSWATRLWSF